MVKVFSARMSRQARTRRVLIDLVGMLAALGLLYIFLQSSRTTPLSQITAMVLGMISLLDIIRVVKRPQCILVHPSGLGFGPNGTGAASVSLFWSEVRYFDLGDRQSFVSFWKNAKAQSVELPINELTAEDRTRALEEIKRYWPDADMPWQDQLAARAHSAPQPDKPSHFPNL